MTELPPSSVGLADLDSGPWRTFRAAWLYEALTSGRIHDLSEPGGADRPVVLESIGTLALPDGSFAAADTYSWDPAPKPFEQRLSADRVEVTAARVVVGEDHDRVAALVLQAGSNPIARWDIATMPGEDVSTLGLEGFFGYGIDGGTVTIGSPEALRVAARVMTADELKLTDPLSRAIFADGLGTRGAAVVAPEEGAEPVAVCSTGWGDGAYATWLGLDAGGDLVVAVCDFNLIKDPYAAPSELTSAGVKSWLHRLLGR